MERRQALKLALVIASISTAFLPWITISFFGFTASVSLAELLTHMDEADSFYPWIVSGTVYLIGSALLLVRDEAPYLQLIGLLVLPAASLMDTGRVGALDTLRLLWAMTGYGLLVAQATTLIGMLVFARPRRALALVQRYFPARSWLDAVQRLLVREEVDDAPMRRHDGQRATIRPAVREVRSVPHHDGPSVRPRPAATADAWWSDGIDDAPRAAPEVPCIRLPPPRARNVTPAVRQNGHHDR
jgi:hypothetical protein